MPLTELRLTRGEREIIGTEGMALARFVSACLIHNENFRFTFETGQVIPWEVLQKYGGDDSQVPANEVVQEQQGLTLEVGSCSFTDEAGKPCLYRTLGQAMEAGQRILADLMTGYDPDAPINRDRDIDGNDVRELIRFVASCLINDVAFSISYEEDEFQLEVGPYSSRGEDGQQKVYGKLAEALEDGIGIVKYVLTERKNQS